MDLGKCNKVECLPNYTNGINGTNGHLNSYCCKENGVKLKDSQTPSRVFKETENSSLGRHLVATQSLKQGELILREKCLVWGPHQLTTPLCLGCGKTISEATSKPCLKCGWPVCGDECQESEAHKPECFYTQQLGMKMSITNFELPNPKYQCITALRVLYLRENDRNLWDRLMKLESHCARRKGTQTYEDDRVFVSQHIRKFYKLEEVFSEEEILKVCGMIQINGYNAPLGYLTIYEEAAKFEHSCRANCTKSFGADGELILTAAFPIEKGDNLSESYSESLWGATFRRRFLYETNYFACSCVRCGDPTECGTHFNSLKCQKGCNGFVLPDNFQENPMEDSKEIWKCNLCDYQILPEVVRKMVHSIEEEWKKLDKTNINNCNNFLNTYKDVLHENHYCMTDIKLSLCQLIGGETSIEGVSSQDLDTKINLCQQLLDLIKILVPAELRIRGTVLFEYYSALTELARRQTDSAYLKNIRLRAKAMLEEAVDVLKYEPEEMPEGKLLMRARNILKDMESCVHNGSN